ncbi:MAG: 3-isopropylmalate dehydrogenase [Anaerolineae bacterium]|nr:3-isopropylmalate dehydrogenase [Thermoflexales bacterium]MDW8396507.1 3-isopropylmalate dehydrogenase [Anaerolineae bacterium]
MPTLRIAVLPGDGIGPEVCAEAVRVLQALNLDLELHTADVGGCAIKATGVALPETALRMALDADAVLFGAVGTPEFDRDPHAPVRPEQAILGLRKALDLFANLRPVKAYDALLDASPLKPEIVRGTDLIILRELTAGAYFGKPQGISGEPPNRSAVDTTAYTEAEVRRLMIMAFELARGRKRKVTQADKANVMATGRLWRAVAHELREEYPEVTYEDMYADACSMHLLRNPRSFDVIATENLFGDILSDEASMLSGSMGMLPSASLGDTLNRHGYRRGLYEPIHGAAHDIAGQGIANPLAMILSAAMMLRWSFGLREHADRVERAVERALADGFRCRDIAAPGERTVGTREMADAVIERLH